MAILVHRYDAPDRFVAGTVGQPGERTFFLQAREGSRITSVACEKQQVSVLAEHLDRVLDEVLRRSAGVVDVPPASSQARDTDPLDAPINEEFRVGTMTIAWIQASTASSSSSSPTSMRTTTRRSQHRLPLLSPTRLTRMRFSWSRSRRPMRAILSPGLKPSSLRDDRHVRSACSRWTHTGMSAHGLTATAGHSLTDFCGDC